MRSLPLAGRRAPATGGSWRTGLRLAGRLFLAHHPGCAAFAGDVHRVGRLALCRGCVAMWPLVAAGLAAGLALVEAETALAWLAASLAGGLPQATTYLRRWPAAMRAAAKLLGGAAFGLFVAALAAWPVPLAWKAAVAAAVTAGALAGQALRLRSMLATCRACPWGMDWEGCPGFRDGVAMGWTEVPPSGRAQPRP